MSYKLINTKAKVLEIYRALNQLAIDHGYQVWLRDYQESMNRGNLYLVLLSQDQKPVVRAKDRSQIIFRVTRKIFNWLDSKPTENKDQAMNLIYHLVSGEKGGGKK